MSKHVLGYIAVFFLGFFIHSFFSGDLAGANKLNAKLDEAKHLPVSSGQTSSELATDKLKASAKLNKSAAENSSAKATNLDQPVKGIAVSDSSEGKSLINDKPLEMSDAEIDQYIPQPFNKQMKGIHGALREKYKSFVETAEPSSWEKEMQNKLYDGIYSSPYLKFIKIEFLQCRAGLCEIRLYEEKPGVWGYIMSGMSLQDWWAFGMLHSSGFKPDDKNIIGYEVLLSKP